MYTLLLVVNRGAQGSGWRDDSVMGNVSELEIRWKISSHHTVICLYLFHVIEYFNDIQIVARKCFILLLWINQFFSRKKLLKDGRMWYSFPDISIELETRIYKWLSNYEKADEIFQTFFDICGNFKLNHIVLVFLLPNVIQILVNLSKLFHGI